MHLEADELKKELEKSFGSGEYQFRTTLYNVFEVANRRGVNAIDYAYEDACIKCYKNIISLTDLAMAMREFAWKFDSFGNRRISQKYTDFYYRTCRIVKNGEFSKDEQNYFYMCIADRGISKKAKKY